MNAGSARAKTSKTSDFPTIDAVEVTVRAIIRRGGAGNTGYGWAVCVGVVIAIDGAVSVQSGTCGRREVGVGAAVT